MLPSRGIVVIEHERNPLSHGDVTWIERKKVFEIANKFSSKIIFLFSSIGYLQIHPHLFQNGN